MLVGLQNLTFEFGARVIVGEATWHIHPGERIGLIGYNGTGKSTILKLLAGEYQPSAGTVEKSRETTIGYLHQDLLSFSSSDSILTVAMGAFERVLQLEKEIEELGHQLEKSQDDVTLHRYSDALHELETLDGYSIHHRTEEVLQGLGFSNADLNRPYAEFSGGWRMRVLLAKMILQAPDVLLLDEPTNHLDLPSIEWLEKYLLHYQGSVVIVSHDKYFLDRMVTEIVELYQQQLHFYTGNYSFYEKEKVMRMELQQRAFENQREYIRQQERFIERFRAKATKAAAAQSAMKRLDKLERIEDVALERPEIRMNFQVDVTPGRVLCTLLEVSKKFGDLVILNHTGAEIERGDKIALIGANGKGKSTLLRIIAGVESHSGERRWGHNVQESFYAQHQLEALDLSHTILDEMKNSGSRKTEQELRTLLGCFLFSGEDVDKKIKVLSGGEKARVALAKVIVSKANFLMLDEPTNHLDIHSVELMIEALNRYEGSIILVSHDRYFISKTANTIWEIEDQKIRIFKGTYDEWLDWRKRKDEAAKAAEAPPPSPKQAEQPKAPAQAASQPAPIKGPINKEVKKEYQKHQKRFQQVEAEINKIKEEIAGLEAALAAPDTYSNKDKFIETEARYKKLSPQLSQLTAEYETLFEKVMDLEEKMKE